MDCEKKAAPLIKCYDPKKRKLILTYNSVLRLGFNFINNMPLLAEAVKLHNTKKFRTVKEVVEWLNSNNQIVFINWLYDGFHIFVLFDYKDDEEDKKEHVIKCLHDELQVLRGVLNDKLETIPKAEQ